MALPRVIARNQTAGAIFLDRLGLSVPASGTLELTLYSFVDEIKNDDSLHQAIIDDEILLDLGEGELTKGESLKFFGIITHEVRIQTRALSDADISPLSGSGQTVDTSVSLAVDDRVLLTAQTPASENGVWVVRSGAWERPDDFAAGTSASAALIYVAEGNTYGSQLWACDSLLGSDVVDTDTLSFSAVSGGGGGGGEDLQQTYDNGTGGDGVAGRITTNSTDGRVLIAGTESLQVTATGGLDVDTIADFDVTTFDVQMTGTNGFSLDGTAASNVTVDAGNLTVSTTTSGEVLVDGIDGVEVNSSTGPIDIGNDADTGAINIGTGGAARAITVGNNAVATTILLDNNTTINGNLDVLGTTTSIDSEVVNIADQYLYLNKDYTTAAGQSGGLVLNYLPTSDTDTTTTGGFATTSTVNVTTTDTTFAAGDIIQVSGAQDPANDGVYEVISHTGGVITIDTTPTEDFSQSAFTVDTTDTTATITQVGVSVLRQNGTTGEWEIGIGNTVPLTYSGIVLDSDLPGAVTLQQAYINGNTITTSGAEGNVTISGTEDLLVTTSDVDIDTTATVSIDATTSIAIGGDADTSSIDIGTGAAARTVTMGNTTGATGVVINSGTEQVEVDGVTYYGISAGNPTATTSGFQDGDKYYDSGLDMEMRYDATRAKWLSVESMTFQFGRNGNTNTGQYYRSVDGRVMSSTIGFHAPHNGTIVALAYTRSDADTAVFDVVEGGTSRATVDTSAPGAGTQSSGRTTTLNGDFTAGGVLAVVNQAGGNATSNVSAWFKVKFRA